MHKQHPRGSFIPPYVLPVCTLQVVAKLPPSGDSPRFESFNLWGDFAGPDAELDEESGMIFHSCSHHLDQLVRVREFRCPVRGCKGVAKEENIGHMVGGKDGQAFATIG